jgi:glycine hydroxymethyltransferase
MRIDVVKYILCLSLERVIDLIEINKQVHAMNEIFLLTEKELIRQKKSLNLIASENYPSPKVLNLLGSVWSNKYGEGYPGKRYYAGNQLTDQLETKVQELLLKVFECGEEYGVNVQVLSGSPANGMVFLSVLNYGDTVLSLNINNGGHLSHLHSTSNWNKFFKHIQYDLKEREQGNFEIDIQDYEQKISEHKPKLVIIGFSSYPRKYEFEKLCQIAHSHGSLVLADIAHINGLVASGLHDTPFKKGISGADFVSMTTHKTFRGPRGAVLFAKNYLPNYISNIDIPDKVTSLIDLINKTVFPGTSGGPHFHQIAAVGQACLEILGEESYPDNTRFADYSKNTLDNCKALENSLLQHGLEIISPSQNHLCLAKLPDTIDSLKIQQKLEKFNIILNRNLIPFDQKTAWKPSGLRLGTPALSSRGLTVYQATELGKLICDIIFDRNSYEVMESKVYELLTELHWWY